MPTAAEAMAGAGNGAPAPAAAPAAPAPGGAAPAAAPAGSAPPWYGANVKPETKALIDAKKWDSIDALATGYANVEKLVGKDPASVVVLPKEGEDMAPVWNKLGRPEKPEGYKLEGELGKDPLAVAALAPAHALGLTNTQVNGLAKWLNESGTAAQTKADETFAKNADTALQTFKQQSGQGYDRQLQQIKATAAKLGLTADEATAIEKAIGTEAFLKKFAKAGDGLLEPQFVDGHQRAASGQLTPEQATVELKALGNDQAFQAKLRAKDKDALARVKELTAARAGMTVADMEASIASGRGLERTVRG